MRQVAALIVISFLTLSSNAQRAVAPLPTITDSNSDSRSIVTDPTNTTTTPNTPISGPVVKSETSNGGQDEYLKKYQELVDSLALKKEKESKKSFDDLSASYHYANYGLVAAGIIICALLGIVYGLYQKNKTLKSQLNKLKS